MNTVWTLNIEAMMRASACICLAGAARMRKLAVGFDQPTELDRELRAACVAKAREYIADARSNRLNENI